MTLAIEHPPAVARSATTLVVIARNRMLLESLPNREGPLADFDIVGRSTDLDAGDEVIRRLAPDVILLDSPNFVAAFRSLAETPGVRLKQSRLAVLADDLTDAQLEIAVACGVTGLLSDRDSIAESAALLKLVAAGEARVSARLSDRATVDARTQTIRVLRRSCVASLSPRQLDVLLQIASGKRVREIATEMDLTQKAVESHKHRLFGRLGFSDRVDLCRWAIREGLINP